MEILIKIITAKSETWIEELSNSLRESGIKIHQRDHSERKGSHVRGLIFPPEIIVALGSAGAFTAFYQVICKIIERNKNREITIERGSIRVSIKGHSFPEEMELIKKLAPELSVKKVPNKIEDSSRGLD